GSASSSLPGLRPYPISGGLPYRLPADAQAIRRGPALPKTLISRLVGLGIPIRAGPASTGSTGAPSQSHVRPSSVCGGSAPTEALGLGDLPKQTSEDRGAQTPTGMVKVSRRDWPASTRRRRRAAG